MRTTRYVRVAILLAAFSGESAFAQTRCDKTHHPPLADWMVAKETRAYFHSASTAAAAPAPLKSFVVRGDLVETSWPDEATRASAPPSEYVCAVYYAPDGRARAYGWLKKSDLLAVDLNLDREAMEPSSEMSALLSALPAVRSWPAAAKTVEPCNHEDGFIGDFLCVTRFDAGKGVVCLTATDRGSDPECGKLGHGNRYASFESDGQYAAYLFNNGIAVVSQSGGVFGNHGQTDPSGVYAFSPSAAQSCR